MKDKLKVAAYCRVSTDKDDQANSLENQIKYFTDYISNNDDWDLVEVYYDEGITGTSTKKRIGFNRMIEHAFQGKFALILTKEVSRFARNTVDTLSYSRSLKDNGIGIVFTLDNIDTRNPDDEFRLSLMASIAQEESRKTSERVKWGQTRQMEKGVVFGRDLLGYYVKEGRLIINPDEVDTVKLIFHKFTNEGKGTHVIARELREAGIRPKRVKEWSNTVILRVLRNEKYVGDLCQRKTFTPDYLTHDKKYNRGEIKKVFIPDHHEPIVDRDMWERTQKELARRAPDEEQKTKHSNRYWCSGKLVCGECGRRFVSRKKKRQDGSQYKAWRCFSAASHGTAKVDVAGNHIGCDSASINDQVLLACMRYVCKHVRVNREKIIKEILAEIKALQTTVVDVDTEPLYRQIEDLTHKKRKAVDLVLDGTISREDLKEQNRYYDEEIASLSRQIADAESTNSIHRQQADDMSRYVTEINKMIDFDEDNELLYKELLDRIVVFNKKQIVVYLKCLPFGMKLKYRTSGKMEKYKVDIVAMSIDNKGL